MDGNVYRNNKLIVGIDTAKLLGLSFTGMNTRNHLMNVHLKTQDGDYKADRMHIMSKFQNSETQEVWFMIKESVSQKIGKEKRKKETHIESCVCI